MIRTALVSTLISGIVAFGLLMVTRVTERRRTRMVAETAGPRFDILLQ